MYMCTSSIPTKRGKGEKEHEVSIPARLTYKMTPNKNKKKGKKKKVIFQIKTIAVTPTAKKTTWATLAAHRMRQDERIALADDDADDADAEEDEEEEAEEEFVPS